MSDFEVENPWRFAAVVLLVWITVSVLTRVVLPATIGGTISAAIAGGVSFTLLVVFVLPRFSS
jgi:hypothetical protein